MYLDDYLIVHQDKEVLQKHIQMTIESPILPSHLSRLDSELLIVHPTTSEMHSIFQHNVGSISQSEMNNIRQMPDAKTLILNFIQTRKASLKMMQTLIGLLNPVTHHVTKDAYSTGWGAQVGNFIMAGKWTIPELT